MEWFPDPVSQANMWNNFLWQRHVMSLVSDNGSGIRTGRADPHDLGWPAKAYVETFPDPQNPYVETLSDPISVWSLPVLLIIIYKSMH